MECKSSHFHSTFCHGHQDFWNRYLAWAEYAQNSLQQQSTRLTPFQCVLGFQPPLLPLSGEQSEALSVTHWFQESERVRDKAHQHLQQAVCNQQAMLMPGEPQLPSTSLDRKCGYPPVTSDCTLLARSYVPGLLVPSL